MQDSRSSHGILLLPLLLGMTCPAWAGTGRSFENFSVNTQLFFWINSHHTPIFDTFFSWYRFLGAGWVLVPVFLYLLLRAKPLVTSFLLAVAVETFLVLLLKSIFNAPRPALLFGTEQVHLLLPMYNYSFPSGDTAMATVIAGFIQYKQRWFVKVACWLYVVLIGYERIYLGVHFPLDILAGALIGGIAVVGSMAFIMGWRRRQAANRAL